MPNAVFVSYSRTRSRFASDLVNALIKDGVSSWIDRFGIGPAEQWHSALREGILEAANFVVLLDLAWLDSTICQDEYKLAIDYGKTLIPIVVEEVSPDGWKALARGVPQELASRNYIWAHEMGFPEIVREVIAAVRTDYEWKQLLSRLEQRARRWHASGEGFGLLRGQELVGIQEAVGRAEGREPAMTATVAAFIQASLREELRELEAQRERARQAESRSEAAVALRLSNEEPIASLDHAERAWQRAPTIEALQALGKWYETHPHLVGAWKKNFAIASVALDEPECRFVSCERLDALVIDDGPSQELIVQNLRDLGKVDSMTDIKGFGGACWAGNKLITQRRGHIVTYRYDVFRERYRQSTTGVALPTYNAPMIANPSRSLVALPARGNGLTVYNAATDEMATFPTEGSCVDAAWIDDLTLLVAEGGGLKRREPKSWAASVEVVPAGRHIGSVDASGKHWIALSCTDRVRLYRSGLNGVVEIIVHSAPDLPKGVRLGQPGTAFIYGGGGALSDHGVVEVAIDTGQLIRKWLGGFRTAVTAFDRGGGGWLAAGRRDGLLLLWNLSSTPLDTTDHEPPPAIEPEVEAQIVQESMLARKVRASTPDSGSFTAELGSSDGSVSPGPIPAAVRDGILCVPLGADLVWFDLEDPSRGEIARGSGHTNSPIALACSPRNTLWVSTATNGQNNSLREVFAWDQRSVDPILKLYLPWDDCTRMTFDTSGEVLLLINGDKVIRSLLIDPERWIERGRKMSQMDWSRGD
jgi:TIR domain